jgi:hypothetical protein
MNPTHMQLLLGDEAEKLVAGDRPLLRQRLLEEMANSEVAQKRYWKKVCIGSPEECWEWAASLDTDGYGVYVILIPHRKYLRFLAHRMSYYFKFRNLPKDLCVCHRCDNPKCVNPSHLFLGTAIDNRQDAVKKLRHARGEGQFQHKLREHEALEIRILHFQQGFSYDKLAVRFEVSKQTIYRVVNGFSWKHVPFPKGFEPYE